MDELQEFEALELCNYIPYTDCTAWETTRVLLSAQVDRKKTPKLTDIMKFPWDKKDPEEIYDNMSEEEQEQLRKRQRDYLRKLHENTMKQKDSD